MDITETHHSELAETYKDEHHLTETHRDSDTGRKLIDYHSSSDSQGPHRGLTETHTDSPTVILTDTSYI